MASMGLLLKPSSFLIVNRGDSKPSLKWMRNPPLLRTTQISLPSSMMMMMMIKNNSTSTTSGFIRTIKCNSSSNRGSDYYFRARWVVKEEEEEEHLLFKEGKALLKALTTPVVAAKVVDVLLTNYPALVSSRTAIFFGAMLAYDLCRAIASTTRIDDGRIRFSLGPVLGSIVLFLWALMAVFGKGTIGTVTWEEEGNDNTITHKIIGYMVKIVGYIELFMGLHMEILFGLGTMTLPWPRSKKSTKLQAGVIKEMVNAVVVDSAFGSKDTELAGETAARRPEAARAAHEEDPIAKGDDEEERTRRDKIEHDLLK